MRVSALVLASLALVLSCRTAPGGRPSAGGSDDDSGPAPAVLGVRLAESLHVATGDLLKVVVPAQSDSARPLERMLTVADRFETGVDELDEKRLCVAAQVLATLSSKGSGAGSLEAIASSKSNIVGVEIQAVDGAALNGASCRAALGH